jgi:hypothetical protein
VPRDRDVAFVRQPERDESASSTLRHDVARNERQEAVEHDALDLAAIKARSARAAHEPRASASDRDGCVMGSCRAQEGLLRDAASRHELRESGRIEAFALVRQARLDRVGEREVHVVPAEEQMRPHRDSRDSRGSAVDAHEG